MVVVSGGWRVPVSALNQFCFSDELFDSCDNPRRSVFDSSAMIGTPGV